MLRLYARVVAVVLLATGAAGFSELWGFDPLSGLYHAGIGLLFAFAGFYAADGRMARTMVGGLGVLLVAVKVPMIFAPLLWGSTLQHGLVEITSLVVGITSILAAWYLPDRIERSDRVGKPHAEAALDRRGGDSSAEDQDQKPDYDREQE